MGGGQSSGSRDEECPVCGTQKYRRDDITAGVISLKNICEGCVGYICCSNCGLNFGQVHKRYPCCNVEWFERLEDWKFGEEEPKKEVNESIDLFEQPRPSISRMGNHLLPALNDFPLDENHRKSVVEKLDDMNRISRVHFDSVFSVCTLRKINPSSPDPNSVFTGEKPRFASGVTYDRSCLNFSQVSMNRILCKFCVNKINERFETEYFTNESKKRVSIFEGSQDDIERDSIVSTIGFDALEMVFSFLEFPSSISYLNLVCKNWFYFLNEHTDYAWLTNFTFPDPRGKKRFRADFLKSPILIKEGGLEIVKSIDHRFLGVFVTGDPAICLFGEHGKDFSFRLKSEKNYDDLSLLKYVFAFYSHTSRNFQGFSGLKKITFENRSSRNITDAGACFLLKSLVLVGNSKSSSKTLEMVGLDESVHTTFSTIRMMYNTYVNLERCRILHVGIDTISMFFDMPTEFLERIEELAVYDMYVLNDNSRMTGKLVKWYSFKLMLLLDKLTNLQYLYVNKQSITLDHPLRWSIWDHTEELEEEYEKFRQLDLRLDRLKKLEFVVDEFSVDNVFLMNERDESHIPLHIFKRLTSLETLILIDNSTPDRVFESVVSTHVSATLRVFQYCFIIGKNDGDLEVIPYELLENLEEGMNGVIGSCKFLEEFTFNCIRFELFVSGEVPSKVFSQTYPLKKDGRSIDKNIFSFRLKSFRSKNENLKSFNVSGIRFYPDSYWREKQDSWFEEGRKEEEEEVFFTSMLLQLEEGFPRLNRLVINYSTISDVFWELLSKDEKFKNLRERLEFVSVVGNGEMKKKDVDAYTSFFPNLKVWYQ